MGERKCWALVMTCSWLWEIGGGKVGVEWVVLIREFGRGGEMCRSGQARFKGIDTLWFDISIGSEWWKVGCCYYAQVAIVLEQDDDPTPFTVKIERGPEPKRA